jgi:hypothetical protein
VRFEQTIQTTASPEKIWAIYKDASAWSDWDPEVKAASLDGEFASGVHGELVPTSGRPKRARFYLADVIEDRAFAVESRLPLCVLRVEHEIAATHAGSTVTHRVAFRGALAWLFGPLVGGPIRNGLPATMAGLKRIAEQD